MEFSKTNKDWTIQVTIPTTKQKYIDKSLLKSAYLYCFALWGYEFAFSKTGDLIRAVLTNKARYPIGIMPLKLDKTIPQYDNIKTGVCYVSKPNVLKSFVVNIRIKDKLKNTEAIYPVFIPKPSETGIEELQRIQKAMDEKITGDITFIALNSILNQTPLAYSQTWNEVKSL
jgi:hypothetical protein